MKQVKVAAEKESQGDVRGKERGQGEPGGQGGRTKEWQGEGSKGEGSWIAESWSAREGDRMG